MTGALHSSTTKSSTSLSYLMALLNRVEAGLLGAGSLRYPYFSRNAWGREKGQLSHGVAPFPLPGSPRAHVTYITPRLIPFPNKVYEL